MHATRNNCLMNRKFLAVLTGAFSLSVISNETQAQLLFSDNFDVDHTANWTVNKSLGGADTTSTAEFLFDYSSVGIPSAPNSGGSTLGLRMRANMSGNVFSGLSVSPTGQGFTGDYRLRFDMWLNYNGRLDGGGNGTTQLAGGGLGTKGNIPQLAGAPSQDSIWFASTLDGGSATDYRAYSSAAPTSYAAGNAVYNAPAGAINNSAAYYTAAFPSQSAPAAQLALYPQQTNSTLAGSPGFAWRDVVIEKSGNIVTWTIDGLRIATVDSTGLSFSTNILLTYFDSNVNSSTDANAPALLFGLFDNVRVEAIPEPAACVLTLAGAAGLYWARRRRSRKH
jgi:hypothetical protein